MMNVKRLMATGLIAAGMWLNGSQCLAQDNAGDNAQGGRGRGGRGNFDPAQMQQMFLERTREDLEVKADDEWKVLEPLVQKVMDARRQVEGDRMRGMFGRRARDRGGDNTDNSGPRRGFFGQPSAEAETLQRAIDGKASNTELKAALAKFIESRKAKQAELEKAQKELRAVLSLRQEAIATANGLL
jgi:hypothetical protein